MLSDNAKAYVFTIVAVLIWSTIPAAFKLVAAALSPNQILFFGMGPAALAFLGYIMVRGELDALRNMGRRAWTISLLLGAWLFLFYTLVFTAYEYLSPQVIMPINNTWSLLMAVLSPFLLKQKVSRAEFGWMFFAYCGVLLSVWGGGFPWPNRSCGPYLYLHLSIHVRHLLDGERTKRRPPAFQFFRRLCRGLCSCRHRHGCAGRRISGQRAATCGRFLCRHVRTCHPLYVAGDIVPSY